MKDVRLRILVVDDEPGIRDMLTTRFELDGHQVATAATGERALAVLSEQSFDVAFLDLNLGGGMNGLELLKQARSAHGDLAAVMISAQGSIQEAVEATKLGAFDFLEKPLDPARLEIILRHLAERAGLKRRARAASMPGAPGAEMIGRSEALAKLITGENGSGKELVARAIHLGSRRADAAFVKLNCAAIPKDLIESELFGYERGAFTGAVQAKKGKLEMADEGTLFLDEIGDLSLDAQAKLLRAIETGEVERVGGTKTSTVDVRLVSATHKDLAAQVRAGAFREDLYFRLNVLPLHVPPLRERKEDIALLAQHFMHAFAQAEGLADKELTPEAVALLEGYSWPGNVRELRNLMERTVILVPGPLVDAADIADWLVPITRSAPPDGARGEEATGDDDDGPAEPGTLREELERREAEAIVKVLEGARWNVTQAAAQLGVDRTNLHRKMRKYGIRRNAREDEA
jgi:two-component system nitrogen regulation response regulator NtrX